MATLLFVQRAGDLARYKWTLFFGGAFALLLPMMPLIGNAQNGARISGECWMREHFADGLPG